MTLRRLVTASLTVLGLTASSLVTILATTTGAADSRAASRAPAGVRLSVMTQNIFYGGDDYDLATGGFCPVANGCPKALHRLAHVISISGADVVGVQEAERNTRRLARMLGWYASPRAHVISRFPILDPPHGRGVYTYVEPVPGRVVAVANTHLPSTPYGPYRVRHGWSRHRVLHLERTLRVPALKPVLRRLPRLAARGVPVFLTGDFNSPSYLDWTPAVAKARAMVPYAVRWPASKALADAGFHDSYREIHPDPIAYPGYTWSPGGPETKKHDFPDRIDWVLHAGPSTVIATKLVGERGDPQADITVHPPYPTDHRGVVSTFEVTPAPAPIMVSPGNRRVITGSRGLHVRFHAHGLPGEVVGLLRPGSHRLLRQANARGRQNGVVDLRTTGLRPGRYAVALRDSATGRIEARAPVWVYRPGSRSHVWTDRRSYRYGAPVRIHWTRAPGNNLDWIGLFPCHRRCGGVSTYLDYLYTHTDVVGSVTFRRGAYLGEGEKPWPLPPGQYVARLLLDDGYHSVGTSARFRIRR
ncbi:MAG TPA: endonuclease/exonuclease/phosphatase family protein [Nocardioides sp.]|uniref:endonuclease/exonuclease/phosphatase family protein n=1 Tax=Nocardioides sp. TaxID=35761 RepID=UPI002E336E59|nr:endonuclease/exonuclease/phosphatase family protein [Nocardioides sp.]HEX3931685.1 endonuclease/exonuclease/phosphatase family protein [Nocardioides sp.]